MPRVIGVFQAPGANALAVARRGDREDGRTGQAVSARHDLRDRIYDPTIFVRESIDAVVHTLLEAVLLVVLVVILFLQTWRASIIPLIAVPVSVVGTFAALYLLGFSINTLTLFGLVLAIGIVVDDAIVVVENVERNIEEGRTPLEAAHQAMQRGLRADRRDRAGAVRGIRADGVPDRRDRPVLQAVRRDDRDLDGDLGDQLADACRRRSQPSCSIRTARRRTRSHACIDRIVRLVLPPVQSFLQGQLGRAITARCARILKRRGRVFAVYALLLLGTGLMFKPCRAASSRPRTSST